MSSIDYRVSNIEHTTSHATFLDLDFIKTFLSFRGVIRVYHNSQTSFDCST